MISRVFKAFQYRDFRLMWFGACVSSIGTWMQIVAQSWLIYRLSHSAFLLALDQFLGGIPIFLFSLIGGVVADRVERRRILLGSQYVQLASSALLAILVATGVVHIWHILCLSFVSGLAQAFGGPAYQALIPTLVKREDMPNAIALQSMQFNTAVVVGPALAGPTLAGLGDTWCFALNAASFVAVLAGLLAMRTAEFHPLERRGRPTILRGTREGLGYVRRRPAALIVLAGVVVLSTFCFNFNVLLPVLAKQTLHSGPQTLGLLSALFGAGALVGALAAAAQRRPSLKLMLIGSFLFTGSELLLAPERSTAAIGALLFVTGVGFTLWTSNSNSSLQLEAPDHLRGRVVGLYYYAFNGTGPVGGMLAGWLMARGGSQLAFLVAGLAGLTATVWAAQRLRAPAGAEPGLQPLS